MRLLAPLLFVLLFVSSTSIAHANISGAAGNVEYWRGLGGSPRPGVLFVVLHNSWGPYGSGRNTARDQSGGGIGSEWWVLADGTIIHSDSERVTGHCGANPAPGVGRDCNRRGVGIEFEGFGQHTAQQVRSGLALVRFLQERYCIKSADVVAHRKAGGGSEGVAMEQAARNMGHTPSCSGASPSGSIPDSLVSQTVQSPPVPGSGQPTLLGQPNSYGYPQQQGYPQPSPSNPQGYGSAPTGGSQYILGGTSPYASPGSPTSYAPVSGATVPTTPSAPTLLQQIAYPSPAVGEEDAASLASAKTAQQLSTNDIITIVAMGSTTALQVPLKNVVVPDTVYVSPVYKATETFAPSLPAPQPESFGTTIQFTALVDGLRNLVNALMRLLGR